MNFKTQIHNTCLEILNEKIQSLNLLLDDLKDGMQSDAKSSAGDKHETARAMAQIEIEKISKQLHEANLQKEMLQKIDMNSSSKTIIKGSLIETDKGTFYLSIALGKILVDDKTIMVLSTQSPLGQKLMGLKVTDVAQINASTYKIIIIS